MKVEYKWILTIELEVDEDAMGTNDPDRLINEANYAMERAQDRFFDTFNSNDNIASWEVIDEELK
jgi:hypothetical protein